MFFFETSFVRLNTFSGLMFGSIFSPEDLG
jgi:hypothetical protein